MALGNSTYWDYDGINGPLTGVGFEFFHPQYCQIAVFLNVDMVGYSGIWILINISDNFRINMEKPVGNLWKLPRDTIYKCRGKPHLSVFQWIGGTSWPENPTNWWFNPWFPVGFREWCWINVEIMLEWCWKALFSKKIKHGVLENTRIKLRWFSEAPISSGFPGLPRLILDTSRC